MAKSWADASFEEKWGVGGLYAQQQQAAKSTPTQIVSTSTPSYTTPSTPTYTTPATSYTGSANVIGNVSGSKDLGKSYQDLYNSTRNDTNQYSQLNTYADNQGNVYDTTKMTAQQIFALSLYKDNNPKAAAILKGMGLDMNGNPTSPPVDYSKYTTPGVQNNQASSSSSSSSNSSGSQTSSAWSSPTYQTGTAIPLSNNPADYAPGGKYYSAPTYNVNNAAFLDKPAEERLAIFAKDPTLAAQEIERAKQKWSEKMGDPAAQAQIHAWADQVRAAAGLPADGADDAPVGGGNPGVGSGVGSGTGTGTGVQPQPTGVVKDPKAVDWNDPNGVLGTIGEWMKQTKDALTNQNDAYWASQKAASDAEQQSIFESKKSQYQNLIDSLKSGQKNDLQAITSGIDSATNKIEDKSFQDWLAARQNAASRGLAGSGLASDMNTRLLLSKQRDLADMFTQKNNAMNDVNRRYSDQINNAQSGIANTNLPAMQAEAFQKLFASGQGNLTDQAKMFADLFGKLSGQNQTSESDKLKALTDKYATDVKYKYLYDKMDNDTKVKTAQLQLEWEKHGLDITKVFGQDANGRPTLDAQKMVAEISQKAQQMAITQAHNAVTEKQGWARINQSDQDMQIKLQAMENQTAQFKERMKLDSSKADDAQLGRQVDAIKSIMTSEGSNLRSIRTKLDSKDLSAAQKQSLEAEYAQSLGKIEAAQNSMGEIYKFKTGGTVNYSGDAPQPFNMNDMDYGDNSDSIG